MSEQVYVCDAVTGGVVDRLKAAEFPYQRLLSAGGDVTVSIPLDDFFKSSDGSWDQTLISSLFQPWSRTLVLERDGVIEYKGYIVSPPKYSLGGGTISLQLVDLWTMWSRRLAVDHAAPNVEKWSTTLTGTLASQAAQAMLLGRYGSTTPSMVIPIAVGTFPGTPATSRPVFGYHLETVADVLDDLMDRGLDIYFRPQWAAPGIVGWLLEAGVAWSSGTVREFSVTAQESPVTAFSVDGDALRVTNNAVRVGEGSEVDMLVRSNRNLASPLPLLERATQSKTITSIDQLIALANQDLAAYAVPTSQWSFEVQSDFPIDVGDTARMHFDGDPVIPDGWHTRRVVKVSGAFGSARKTIGVQPTGGA